MSVLRTEWVLKLPLVVPSTGKLVRRKSTRGPEQFGLMRDKELILRE